MHVGNYKENKGEVRVEGKMPTRRFYRALSGGIQEDELKETYTAFSLLPE